MKKSHFDEVSSKNEKNKIHFSKLTSFLILGAVLIALVGIGTLVFSGSSKTVEASQTKQDKKKYIATKEIVVDQATGQLRKPNEKELKELVDSLKTLTKRSAENLESFSLPKGGEAVNLDGNFQGTILARPKSDGTMEVRCVFTFEEATEFLGLVEETNKAGRISK